MAVCGRDAGRTRVFAERFGVEKWYTDSTAMMKEAGVQAVHNCTNTAAHDAINRSAIAHGLHVYAEKPFGINREEGAPVLVFSTAAMPEKIRRALAPRAALYLDKERVNLRNMLEILHSRHKVRRVVCEGGAGLLRSLLEERLVDELNLTFCPRIFGGEEAPTLTGVAGDFLRANCKLESLQVEDDEAFARYRIEERA